ncbi:MAG: hypothetical protein R3C69_16215 [Geminicoccaceae bacterium]
MADRSGRRDTVLALGLAGFAAMLVAAVLAPLWAVPAIFVGLGLTCGISGGPILSLPSLASAPRPGHSAWGSSSPLLRGAPWSRRRSAAGSPSAPGTPAPPSSWVR